MSVGVLEKLFSSGTLVKVMRLFLFNESTPHDIDDVVNRTKSRRQDVKYEISLLEDIGFLKKRIFYKDVQTKNKKRKPKKKKVRGWILNPSFAYLPQLRALLVNKQLLDKKVMKAKLQKVGNVKLILAAGVFVQDADARLDLLVVADKVRPAGLHAVVKGLEALIGAELRYALFGGDDFRYRMSVRDRLLRDVFDRPYTQVVNTYRNLDLPKDARL